jgi:enamine deaminase RidA (YjgF/YER057c/UK114 family)
MTMKHLTLTLVALFCGASALADDVVRYPLGGGSTFPIARAVEVPAGYSLVFHSGLTPAPADEKAEKFSAAYWGDTKTQALSVFARMKESLDNLGLGFGDVVAMTAYLVGDPAQGGRMDFAGFMAAYSQYFGTKEQPNLPSRSTVQVAGLAAPGMQVEIEVFLARPPKK